MSLFQFGTFQAANGPLPFKIECDALTEDDWACIAAHSHKRLPEFGKIVSVPRGGKKLATHLKPYKTPGCKVVLFVDDVWTTGKSLRAVVAEYMVKNGAMLDWNGFVAFARGPIPIRIRCFMHLSI